MQGGYTPQGMQQHGQPGYGQQQMSMPRRWHGHYEQFGSKHVMQLMLVVDFMTIRGQGQDGIGAFDINGQFNHCQASSKKTAKKRNAADALTRGIFPTLKNTRAYMGAETPSTSGNLLGRTKT